MTGSAVIKPPRRAAWSARHCDTGGLATVAWGTALGAIRELAAAGDVEDVLAGRTRPLRHGARRMVWEAPQAGIPSLHVRWRRMGTEPGWFRLCHAIDTSTVTGVNRLIRALETS